MQPVRQTCSCKPHYECISGGPIRNRWGVNYHQISSLARHTVGLARLLSSCSCFPFLIYIISIVLTLPANNMSGFEAVGIILGAWPIVVTAMSAYKSTRNGTGLSLMLSELKVEEMIYSEFVHHLLQSDISDQAELLKLSSKENPDLKLWKKKTLHDSLKRRLGDNKTAVVFEKLEEMKKLLTNLNTKLGGNDLGVVRPI
jgi:hypothetical protein